MGRGVGARDSAGAVELGAVVALADSVRAAHAGQTTAAG